MTSPRQVAFSLVGIAAACGVILLFSLSSAKGQSTSNTAASSTSNTVVSSTSNTVASSPGSSSGMSGPGMSPGMSGAPTAGAVSGVPSGTAMPSFSRTVGISPVQTGKKSLIILSLGDDNNNNLDLQKRNVYSLLTQAGTTHSLILDPLSTAKPSFILERLITVSLTGGSGTSTSGSGASSSSLSGSSSSEGAGGATQAPAGPSSSERTIALVREAIDGEISRSSGPHRRKLQLLSQAINQLQSANTVGAAISGATGGTSDGSSGTGTTSSNLDPREVLYGQARLTARRADRYVPVAY